MRRKSKLSKDGSVHATDEVFNTASHLAGAIFSLAGGVLLVVYASVAQKPWHIVSFSIYALSLFLLFMTSTLHHGVNASKRAEKVLKVLDYSAVFLLIAGSVTPLCLTVARGPLGWSVFGVTWMLAVTGIALKGAIPHIAKWVTNIIYICMGWMTILLVHPVIQFLPWHGVLLFTVGGLWYSTGWIVYFVERPNPFPGKFGFHEIWHICVLFGAGSHFAAMFVYILPL